MSPRHKPGMYIVEKRVGRLVEAFARSPVTPADLAPIDQAMEDAVRSIGGPCVVIADFRQTKFLLEEHAAYLGQVFRRHNANIERSAIMVSASSAVGVLQMERLIRDAKHPARRAFRDAGEAALWLDEVLTPPEQTRLRVALQGRGT